MTPTSFPAKFSLISRVAGAAVLGMLAGLSQAQTVTLQAGSSANLYKSENLTFGGTLEKTPASLGAGNYKESTNGASFWVYCLDPLTSLGSPLTYTKMTGAGNAALSTFITQGVVANNTITSYTEQFAKTLNANNTVSDYVNASATTTLANKYDDQAVGAGTTQVLKKVTELFSYAYEDATVKNGGNAIKSAAFQFALWEILGDTKASGSGWANYNAASGGLREGTKASATALASTGTNGYSAALTSQINTYLGALNAGTPTGWANAGLGTASNYTFTVYNSAISQTLVSVTKNSVPVPEPGSLALAGLALFGVVYTRRQSKAKQV